jgi:hypothetical protein
MIRQNNKGMLEGVGIKTGYEFNVIPCSGLFTPGYDNKDLTTAAITLPSA